MNTFENFERLPTSALDKSTLEHLKHLFPPSVDDCRNIVLDEARHYLDAAIAEIDSRFGSGYAIKHPQFIAAFMQTCAIEAVAGTLEREMSYLAETIANAIHESV
jgi:hypothetical protein